MTSNEHLQYARSTYDSFISATKWSVPLIGAIVFFVILLIA